MTDRGLLNNYETSETTSDTDRRVFRSSIRICIALHSRITDIVVILFSHRIPRKTCFVPLYETILDLFCKTPLSTYVSEHQIYDTPDQQVAYFYTILPSRIC